MPTPRDPDAPHRDQPDLPTGARTTTAMLDDLTAGDDMERRALAHLAGLDDTTRAVLAHAGQAINDLWAAEQKRKADLVDTNHAVAAYIVDRDQGRTDHRTRDQVERARSTFNGTLDEHHLALRADRGRARRRRTA